MSSGPAERAPARPSCPNIAAVGAPADPRGSQQPLPHTMLARRVGRAPRHCSGAFLANTYAVGNGGRCGMNTLAREAMRVSARNVAHLTVACSKLPQLGLQLAAPPVPVPMATLTARRRHSTQSSKGKEPARPAHEEDHDRDHDHEHEHAREHEHEHTHSHTVLGSLSHSHSHSHGENGHDDVERVVQALRGGGTSFRCSASVSTRKLSMLAGDKGSRITLIGLAANVGLTVSKGTAGWFLNSASLLADAGHTASGAHHHTCCYSCPAEQYDTSDMIGDLITLTCWKLSRRPPSELYPYGFGKFEVLGSAAVSLLLTGGAVVLGLHSISLLATSLAEVATTIPTGPLHDILVNVTEIASSVPSVAHEHAHEHALDPNAAWFALIGVLTKEWLFRATKKVADEESSPVLYANAYHHRSDAYSSSVALVAILGTWWFPHLPLDPIGGECSCLSFMTPVTDSRLPTSRSFGVGTHNAAGMGYHNECLPSTD